MEHLDKKISNEDLTVFAEKCVLSPSLLARKLKLEESTLLDIIYNHPKDRYEQLYQILWKWKQSEPNATWKDLQQATDSGVKQVLQDLYQNEEENETYTQEEEDEGLNNCVQEEGPRHGEQECQPPPTKVRRTGSPQPSAPPFELVYPIKDPLQRPFINGGQNNCGMCFEETETDSVPSNEKRHSKTNGCHSNEDELTYDNDYSTVLNELGHETRWYDLGLALQLKPSQLDEIKESNRDKISDCRKEMVKVWLKNSMNSYTPSWLTLCNALKEKMVGNKSLARQIARKYKVDL